MVFQSLLIKSGFNNCTLRTVVSPLLLSTRHGHKMRGKRPGEARTLEQRLEEENANNPKLSDRQNIGFRRLRASRSEQLKERLQHLKAQRANPQLEKLARSNELLIDLDQVEADYRSSNGQYDLRVIADHYGIFKDLFGQAYFVPRIPLNVEYAVPGSDDIFCPVYNGNVVKPADAKQAPVVTFDASVDPTTGKKTSEDSYWTLIATNPDGHFKSSDSEYLHWFIGNIPNGDVSRGETLVDYLPPFPPKGIGYQRFIFVLYKQKQKMDFSSYKLAQADYADLDKRTFRMIDFFGQHKENITPAGLAFYQTDWDETLTKFFHNVLDMKEPIYEYDFPAPYINDEKYFPLKQPFNLYMDKHRDIKQVNKEYLERKLAGTHPFDGPEPPPRFPNAHPLRNMPSWLRTEIKKRRLGIGRINDY